MQQSIKRLHKNRFFVFVANRFALCLTLCTLPFIRLLEPNLRRCLIIQIQMRAAMVVKHPKLIQCILQLNFIADAQLPQHRFKRTEQPFHSTILPRTVHVRGLLLNACQAQKRSKHKRIKSGKPLSSLTEAPLRTVLASFPAYGSSLSKPVCTSRFHHFNTVDMTSILFKSV